jgi:hypothetical protein
MKSVKLKYILFIVLFIQLFFVNSVFSYEKIISNTVQFCENCSEEELPVAITILQHLEFLAVHGENHISLSQIKANLQCVEDRLKKSEVVSLRKEGKFCIKGEVTHVVCNNNKLDVPEYFLTNDPQALDRAKRSQLGAETLYENCPKTIKDYAQYPATKLADDKFCNKFLNMHPGIFKSWDIDKCFKAHAEACSFTISVDDETEDIKTFVSPIHIKGKIVAGDSDSGSINSSDSRLIFNFVSEQAFAFSTTKGYLKKFYSVDTDFQLWVRGPKYGIEEVGCVQTTETDQEWEDKIFYALQAKYPDKEELKKALNNIGKGHRRVFINIDLSNNSFEPFDGVGTYTVYMRASTIFLPRTLEETRIFLLSKDIDNKKHLQAAYKKETKAGLPRIRSAINESGNRCGFTSNKLKILFAPEIQLFNGKTKEDSDWTNQANKMKPGSVYFVNDSINVKIDYIKPENGESIDQKVLQIRKFKDDKPLGWRNIPIADLDWRFSPNEKHLYITIPWKKLVELGFCPIKTNDGVPEFASLDFVKNKKSNLNDSIGFEKYAASKGSSNRGNAKGGYEIISLLNPSLTLLTKDLLKSAGVEFVQISFQKMESPIFQIQNQADVFYFSGHGDVLTGELEIFYDTKVSPAEVIPNWDQDLNHVFFAGCSVLKIKNYNDRFPKEPPKAKASPGEKWAKLRGKILYGYCAKAPTDTNSLWDGADTTKNIFMEFVRLGEKPEDWLKANNTRYGRNACVIDTKSIPWRYGCIKKNYGQHEFLWIEFDHKTGKWP